MESMFAGNFGYASDLKLLTPTVEGMSKMVIICARYSSKYDVMFNVKRQ